MTARRVILNLLVMFIAVSLAAAFQDGSAPLPGLRVKLPLLAGVASYYAMLRPWPYAVLAVLWAGLFRDGLSSVSAGAFLPAAFAVLLFCALWARRELPSTRLSCIVVCCACASVQFLSDMATLFLSGRAPLRGPGSFFFYFAATAAAAVPAGFIAAVVTGRLDLWASNTEKHADTIDWSEGRD